jgi:DNA polymerase-4
MQFFTHYDLAQFFTQVEENLDPGLRGHPVIIYNEGRPGKNGFVPGFIAAVNREAKAMGVKRGPYYSWVRSDPRIVKIHSRYRLYQGMAKYLFGEAKKAFGDIPDIRKPHIDDIVMSADIGLDRIFALSRDVRDFFRDHGYDFSAIGISVNDMYAHYAAWMSKENNHAPIYFGPGFAKRFVYPLPVDDLPGIGTVYSAGLNLKGISTIGQLAKDPRNPGLLQEIMGHNRGLNMYESIIGRKVRLGFWN